MSDPRIRKAFSQLSKATTGAFGSASILDAGANLRNIAEELESRLSHLSAVNEKLKEALLSISKNTCCDRCQEAALVAKGALAQHDGGGREMNEQEQYNEAALFHTKCESRIAHLSAVNEKLVKAANHFSACDYVGETYEFRCKECNESREILKLADEMGEK